MFLTRSLHSPLLDPARAQLQYSQVMTPTASVAALPSSSPPMGFSPSNQPFRLRFEQQQFGGRSQAAVGFCRPHPLGLSQYHHQGRPAGVVSLPSPSATPSQHQNGFPQVFLGTGSCTAAYSYSGDETVKADRD